MSAEETKHLPKSGSSYYGNGRSNPGFDDTLRTRDHNDIPDSQGRNQPTDWPKFANDTMEDYLSRMPVPGYHGQSGQQSSGGQVDTDQWDPLVKV